ncbi:hypothetical protein [Photobacterium rosenbergii]|uniref:hypothetical protein n=1 Tax=Photobacterium rosenbergii TaxID=294936 RepID=UPI001C995EB5|nr:hypothetical protein [Photobacterium rosenbergii]MBY5945136.1 hypothetical protein [Photobacterium rosenbergii]
MKASDGSGYIRTRYPDTEGSWQNSHFHITTFETYIVQSGMILYAELKDGEACIKEVAENEVITVKPGVHHNVYVLPNTDLHTVKHGATQAADWHASVELDRLLAEKANLTNLK